MQTTQSAARSRRTFIILFLAVLVEAMPALAQKVVTQDAGGGTKIELHYNAAGNVVETRTIGPDGKLLEKDSLEYPPGALIAQSVSTSYWPNGQAHKVTRNTYDNNSNFTGEFVDIFDETGKQTGGHKLVHNPVTNVYTCSEWNQAANAFKPVDCPSGEESSGTPETVKTFTTEEVQQQLARAHEPQPPPRHAGPPRPAPVGTNVTEVGLVLPVRVVPGESISGSVVDNPADYESSPEVFVTRFAIPFAASGKAATLAGWEVEIHGEAPQPADGAIKLTEPAGQRTVTVLLRAADGSGAPVSKTVTFPHGHATTREKTPTAGGRSYLAPALCVKGQLCVVQGDFSGDGSKTFAAFEQRPARIIAETTDALYLAIPIDTEPGPRPLAIAEGGKAIAFPMVVAEFTLRPPRRDLPKGETLLMYSRVEGAGDLPDPEWRPGNFPSSNLEEARKLLPGFQPQTGESAHEKHEAEERRERDKRAAVKSAENDREPTKESDENEGGELLLVIKNLTPEVANFRESKNGMYVLHLNAAAFKMGDYQYKFTVEAKQTGSFGVQTWLIPLLAPVKAQEFAMSNSAAK